MYVYKHNFQNLVEAYENQLAPLARESFVIHNVYSMPSEKHFKKKENLELNLHEKRKNYTEMN